ncbi:OLC1v1013513C3 [Oldenlandia corymbosa var. corymbosa]|uniref:OLC1v1013513C3 n=1 Tax=Oldenlandia corymbosa var. corymbosa TaxID=529605 RepID=A0AAV1DYM4_OLDCO|nr:OLC1v1013513C3 [Oldenlandia corymbosa var. corymbosa]
MFILPRFLSLSAPAKRPDHWLSLCLSFTTSVSSAEKIMTRLQNDGSNMENSLNRIKISLDATCVVEILERLSLDKHHLGLRFFIWAGLQPRYRHTSYMYGKACELLDIKRNPQIVYDVLDSYRVENCTVSLKMFKVVLNICREAKDANMGLWVLSKMKEFNCRPDTVAYNVVIRLLIEKGEVDESLNLMKEMGLIDLYPDMITYTCAIKGLCDLGRLEDACRLVKAMKGHGCLPNSIVYSALLDGLCKFGTFERAIEMLTEMEKENGDNKPNVLTYTTLIQNFCEKGQSMNGLRVLDRMRDFGCKPNRITMSALIKGLCSEGHLEEVYKVIDKVVGYSVSYDECYSSLVISLWQIGYIEESEMIFKKMLARGFRPDGAASSTVMRQLCLAGRPLDAFHLYEAIEKSGNVTIDTDLYSILLVALSEEKHILEAAKLEKLMVQKGLQVETPCVDSVLNI